MAQPEVTLAKLCAGGFDLINCHGRQGEAGP
jgi:hypothetical protein